MEGKSYRVAIAGSVFHVGVGMFSDGDEVTLISAEGVGGGFLGISASVANERDAKEAAHCCYYVQCLCPLFYQIDQR